MSDLRFEDQLARLEQIVSALEAGNLRLEESLTIFEEGVALARACSRYLETAERRIELLARDESGAISSAFPWGPTTEP
jgi:exodeoxyribonuclease VII small subunit